MNQIITPPGGSVKQGAIPCPVCCGPRTHPDAPPGQVWDNIFDRPVECWECDGTGLLSVDELRELAHDTEDADLLALLAERDPALTPEELGFEAVDQFYADLGGEA